MKIVEILVFIPLRSIARLCLCCEEGRLTGRHCQPVPQSAPTVSSLCRLVSSSPRINLPSGAYLPRQRSELTRSSSSSDSFSRHDLGPHCCTATLLSILQSHALQPTNARSEAKDN